ncbi:metalloregulator ArsR/SmtB family transcription factor [Streptomyces sp. CA-210063]|nr:metalloregulator ArsR/SmtB family transcription factor [Streptomyces sp. CA-210063]UUU29837.1 metalloregulator ArsR/SmtB family transcription factor [Streptomyces sp. CA-210063]
MGHGQKPPASDYAAPRTRLTPENAPKVAETLQALATPSRLLILARLREGPCAATELADAVGMEQSACSHQLRVLRNLGLVTGTRQGRSVVYALHDSHVAGLLDQALYHIEHLHLGLTDGPEEEPVPVAVPGKGAREGGQAGAPGRGGREPLITTGPPG